jgi:hypothetical protein
MEGASPLWTFDYDILDLDYERARPQSRASNRGWEGPSKRSFACPQHGWQIGLGKCPQCGKSTTGVESFFMAPTNQTVDDGTGSSVVLMELKALSNPEVGGFSCLVSAAHNFPLWRA